MRARRTAFFALFLLALLALLYSGEVIFYWIILYQTVILLFSALNLVWTFAGVRFTQNLSAHKAVKGENIELTLEVHNELPLPLAHLTLAYTTTLSSFGAPENLFSVSMLPRSRESLHMPIFCPYRGIYTIGFHRMEATDLFGLIRLKLPFTIFASYKAEKLLVYPALKEVLPASVLNKEAEGRTESSMLRAEELSDLFDLRVYLEGDPLKRIHWKRSARDGTLLVKRFEGSLTSDNLLMVDCTAHPLSGEAAAAFEDTLTECATAFVKRLTDNDLPLKLITYSDARIELSGSSPADFPAMHEYLAKINFRGDLQFSSALKLEMEQAGKPDSLILLIKAPSDELFEQLIVLSERNIHILLIMVPEPGHTEERLARMIGELLLHGVDVYSLQPGDDISAVLGGVL